MNITDVMIHINESMSEAARASLEDSMRKVEGVVSPRFSPSKQHLMLIAFDPEKTNSVVLLEKARSAGYTAQLVGM